MGFAAVRLHYSADPSKDPSTEHGKEWLERVRRLFPDPNKWAQEMEINWFVAQGARVFPEFMEHRHCSNELDWRRRKVLLRAWDFGWHAPACLIAQIDERDRLLIFREIIGHEETTKMFAQRVIDTCVREYPMCVGWEDVCDPAGQHVSSAASEKNEARDVEILNALSIFPRWEFGWSRKDGRTLVHQLLAERQDGTPGLLVDGMKCPVMLQAFLGKYVYPPRKGGQVHDEPEEDNHPWADVIAALRYLVTCKYSSLGLRRPERHQAPVAREVEYHGYGTPKRKRQ